MSDAKEISARAIATYKGLLREALDNRPSGTRLKLAAALGTNRSFISQITNPGYPIPIPAQHLDVIFEVCRLASAEKTAFLAAYHEAHPGRAATFDAQPRTRTLAVTLPDFADAGRNLLVDKAVLDFVARLVHYTREIDKTSSDGAVSSQNDL
jgi:phage tail protein X